MRHVQFLRNLRQLEFSGQLIRTDATDRQWIFYLSQGSIVYATGGLHPVRRWLRNLAIYCPHKATNPMEWYSELVKIGPMVSPIGWEYTLLHQWVSHGEITTEQALKIIHAIVTEVLFDLNQAGEVRDQIRQDSALSAPIGVIRLETVTAKSHLRWQAWQNAKLTGYSPHQAPIIKHPEKLRAHSSEEFYQNLVNLLNGQRTLLDLAAQMRRDVVEVTASLLPFIRLKWIDLIDIADLLPPTHQRSLPAAPTPSTKPQRKLIACVDDSFLVRYTMEKLLTSAGYDFLGVEDAVRSIGILLARKPDLIFLDLVMPNGNGHELCTQLRKLSCFHHTPIVILTGNDGYANRLRSNFVGASDFLGKPLNAEAVLNVIHKHLEQSPTANFSTTTNH